MPATANVEETKLISIKEIARRMDVSERSCWRLSDAGKLPPSILVGRLRKWKESDISAFIANNCRWPVRSAR